MSHVNKRKKEMNAFLKLQKIFNKYTKSEIYNKYNKYPYIMSIYVSENEYDYSKINDFENYYQLEYDTITNKFKLIKENPSSFIVLTLNEIIKKIKNNKKYRRLTREEKLKKIIN